jgi:HEAT repeat protein
MVDADSQDRNLILEALSQIGTRTLKPLNQALAISLQDKNPQVRKNAIRDLTRIYDVMSQISQMLWYVLEDSDSDVKATAKWAIDQLNVQMQMPVRFDNHARSPQGTVSVEQSYAESGE